MPKNEQKKIIIEEIYIYSRCIYHFLRRFYNTGALFWLFFFRWNFYLLNLCFTLRIQCTVQYLDRGSINCKCMCKKIRLLNVILGFDFVVCQRTQLLSLISYRAYNFHKILYSTTTTQKKNPISAKKTEKKKKKKKKYRKQGIKTGTRYRIHSKIIIMSESEAKWMTSNDPSHWTK